MRHGGYGLSDRRGDERQALAVVNVLDDEPGDGVVGVLACS